jgi:energy-coupling factor transporter ATP-binding protein EcfA2
MKIHSITIQNFRGIRYAKAAELGSTVIVAGQNGSGKSCIFDAIRLLKSAYGGYQQNEWHQFMGEFAINLASADELNKLFNEKGKPLVIECLFELADEEKAFITSNAEALLTDSVWKAVLPEAFAYGGSYRLAMFATQFREKEPEVAARVKAELPQLLRELAQPDLVGRVMASPGGSLSITHSLALPVIFTSYRPREIGVIDYHGAQRHYGREVVQSINISLDQAKTNQRQHALYNYANKYANVKSEMAGSYVKEILAEQAGIPKASQNTLTNTLKELFEAFFPDKIFDGPVPTGDGNLSFPVHTSGGSTHDLDDLSAGEKEILYGYLRIRNSAPRFSIILLDEPELHLNPRLIRGLPQFYKKNLGEALDNQIWLVSHSDALLREAVGKPGFDVFHMQPSGLLSETGAVAAQVNQLKPISVNKELDIALTDLVGDLAAYQPGRKAVIFEGGGDTDFDQWMTSRLFPEIAAKANLISGTNKHKVKALHEVLDRAFEKGDLLTEFFAIVDKDFEDEPTSKAVRRYTWDVYHIENYLLDPEIIRQVVSPFYQLDPSVDKIADDLKECARSTLPKAVRHRITEYVSQTLLTSINLAFDPLAADVAVAIHDAANRSIDRINTLRDGLLGGDALKSFEENAKQHLETAFGDGSWKRTLPGRDILKAYANTLPNGISYETLRNMIVNKMADLNHRPDGMSSVIDAIFPAPGTGKSGPVARKAAVPPPAKT